MAFLWIITLVSAAGGGGLGLLMFVSASGAPQEAAAMAFACAAAVVPYVVARSVQELRAPKPKVPTIEATHQATNLSE